MEKKEMTISKNEQAHNYAISMIRFISVIFIITCHIMQYYNFVLAWWFKVGVQIFFCISGYLYGQKEKVPVMPFYRKCFMKILHPYWITMVTFGIVEFLFFRESFSSTHFIGSLLCRTTIAGGEHLWFVPVILMCYVITPFLNEFRDRIGFGEKRVDIMIVIATVVLTNLFFGLFVTFFNPAWMCCYVLGFWIGVNQKRNFINEKLLLLIFMVLAATGNGLQIYLFYLLKPGFINSTAYSYWCDYNHVWLGIFLFLFFMRLFRRINWNEKVMRILITTDKYSYETYLVHQFFILGPMSLMAIAGSVPFSIVIIYGCIIVSTFILKRIEKFKLLSNIRVDLKTGVNKF